MMKLRSGCEATQRPKCKRDVRACADHKIHHSSNCGPEYTIRIFIQVAVFWNVIQKSFRSHRCRFRLTGLHAKDGKDLLDVLMLVNPNRFIRTLIELDPKE